MTEDEYNLYNTIRNALAKNPEWLETCISAISKGTRDALDTANKDKLEWEVVAVNATEARLFSTNRAWLADKITGLAARSAFRWDAVLEKMRATK